MNTDGRDLDELRALHQDGVDLERRDVDAAADDELLLAAGDVQIAVGVEEAEIAGADASPAVDADHTIVRQVAIGIVGTAAELDAADLAGRQHPSGVIHDAQAVAG